MLTEIQFQSPVPSGTGAAVTPTGAPVRPSDASGFGYPRAFKIETSVDGSAWNTVAGAAGRGEITTVTFPPTPARKLRLTLTADAGNGPAWSLQDLRVFAVK